LSFGEGGYAFGFEASASAPLTNTSVKEKDKDLLKEKIFIKFSVTNVGAAPMCLP
jgi:hypothetical protein